ncbi:hypothetical protein JKY72_01480 [Candidatus Gracilibacteria bacterium]|nr:hypothetical protein [Candidatus Gracilibacteria bacterium]
MKRLLPLLCVASMLVDGCRPTRENADASAEVGILGDEVGSVAPEGGEDPCLEIRRFAQGELATFWNGAANCDGAMGINECFIKEPGLDFPFEKVRTVELILRGHTQVRRVSWTKMENADNGRSMDLEIKQVSPTSPVIINLFDTKIEDGDHSNGNTDKSYPQYFGNAVCGAIARQVYDETVEIIGN